MLNHIQPRLGDLIKKMTNVICRGVHFGLIIAFVVIITALVYSGLSIIFQMPSFSLQIFCLVSSLWIVYNIIFNYVMATLVHPGNPTFVPNHILKKINKKCLKCGSFKPPRTHHCSMCNQCVLQMDHHCPWLGTCVGHHNRRFFINFLVYICIGLLDFIFLVWQSGQIYKRMDAIAFTGSLFVCLLLFGGFHVIIMLRGQTTLQVCFGDPKYTPSKSICTNFEIIYGTKNCCLAFLPSNQILQYGQYEWSNSILNSDQVQNSSLANNGHDISM